MKFTIALLLGSMAMIVGAPAEETGNDAAGVTCLQEVDCSFEVSRDRLETLGYSQVAMIDDNPLHLTAIDEAGAQVRIDVDPQTGQFEVGE